MSPRPLSAVVLAAGEGTRMRSARPKPLHLLCGRPMVLHIMDTLAELPLERAVVVVGHGAERVTKMLSEQASPVLRLEFVEQHVQRGTGDALAVALTAFTDDDTEDGDLIVLAAGKTMKEINRVDMRAPVYSSPVVANGVLYVATPTHLYAIGKGK